MSRGRGGCPGTGGCPGRGSRGGGSSPGACAMSPRRRPGCGRFPREVTWSLSKGAVPLLMISQLASLSCDWLDAREASRCYWMAAGLGRGRRRRRSGRGPGSSCGRVTPAVAPSPAAANQRVREASLNQRRERRAQSGATAMRKRCGHRDGMGLGRRAGAPRQGHGGRRRRRPCRCPAVADVGRSPVSPVRCWRLRPCRA